MVHLRYQRRPAALPYILRAFQRKRGQGKRGQSPFSAKKGTVPFFPVTASWSGHRADPRELAAFLRIAGLPRQETLPLLYPQVFGFRLVMAVLTHPSFPVPIFGLLQVRNRIHQHQPIPVGARLDFMTQMAATRLVARGAEFDLATTVTLDGATAWDSVTTIYARGLVGAPEAAAAPPRAPEVQGPVTAAWTLRDADHWRFGRFTGDYNGVHFWDAYARRFGFARALYHPPRVLAECLGRLPAGSDEPASFEAWIKGPVPHGAQVQLRTETAAGATTFALFAGSDRPSLIGRWQSGGNA